MYQVPEQVFLHRRAGAGYARRLTEPTRSRGSSQAASGLLELGRGRGAPRGDSQSAAQSLRSPPALDDLVAERLAELVLAQLQARARAAGRAASPSPPRRARRARAARAARSTPVAELAGGGVHDVLGVTLDHRHRRLEPVERSRLAPVGEQPRELAAQRRPDDLARVAHQASRPSSADAAGVEIARAAPSISSPTRPPGGRRARATRANWTTWVALVERDPAQEQVRLGLELALRARSMFSADEQQPRRPLGPEQREVVLAEHPAAPRSRRRPRPRPPTAGADDATARPAPSGPGSVEAAGEPPLERRDAAAQRRERDCATHSRALDQLRARRLGPRARGPA